MANYVLSKTGQEIEDLLNKAGKIDNIMQDISTIEEKVSALETDTSSISDNVRVINEELPNKANKSTSVTVTLTAASWSDNTQTVSVTGVTATNNVVVSPSDRDSTTAWADGEVLCSGQGDGTLTFTCAETPTSDINVSVVIIG